MEALKVQYTECICSSIKETLNCHWKSNWAKEQLSLKLSVSTDTNNYEGVIQNITES